ncbi:hypothetical protein [Shewanella fidelis]|uniref:Uncharacterized protein n=1 Tax=Shewanella fidelis TaxID=173509 RepID=A0AAW8NS00_9GAMM|nr:hypothetical protein [Shewanella fidelis]MDR8525571.1 hypothetical protein [Shewanella fidelis]MDW4813110.1 hypothetical protein [Shewanella fidelis]MDW4817010.1 hypothetical protein [Shewanella fidelis]MDW4820169.1 hypothetical protein [Shewanella fidelis]MDW4825575.1 hypothetical protein [Shewanella fidelis]
MIYSQFQHNPLLNRFSGTRGWLAFAIGLAFMTLALVALPFLLLFGAITFIALSLFGKVFLKRQLARFQKQQANQEFYSEQFQGAQFEETPFNNNVFKESKTTATRQGRTFEHNPNEPV